MSGSKLNLRELVNPKIGEHRGRIVKNSRPEDFLDRKIAVRLPTL